jgi:hypothetical protein
MLEVYREPSVGIQQNSLKLTSPSFTVPRATRSQRQLLHISREHDKLTPSLESPGPVYACQFPMEVSRSCAFGHGPQRINAKQQAVESSNDLLGVIVDDQSAKFRKSVSVLFGTDSRDHIRNATILKHHPQAFYGKESPGPAGYTLQDSMGREGRHISMGSRTRILAAGSQTPESLGPGAFTIPTTCGGKQFLSSFDNQPVFTFGKSTRKVYHETSRSRSQPILKDSFSQASIGPQADSTKPTAVRTILGSQTRDQRARTVLVLSPNEKHCIPRISIPHPVLPSRIEIVRWTS